LVLGTVNAFSCFRPEAAFGYAQTEQCIEASAITTVIVLGIIIALCLWQPHDEWECGRDIEDASKVKKHPKPFDNVLQMKSTEKSNADRSSEYADRDERHDGTACFGCWSKPPAYGDDSAVVGKIPEGAEKCPDEVTVVVRTATHSTLDLYTPQAEADKAADLMSTPYEELEQEDDTGSVVGDDTDDTGSGVGEDTQGHREVPHIQKTMSRKSTGLEYGLEKIESIIEACEFSPEDNGEADKDLANNLEAMAAMGLDDLDEFTAEWFFDEAAAEENRNCTTFCGGARNSLPNTDTDTLADRYSLPSPWYRGSETDNSSPATGAVGGGKKHSKPKLSGTQQSSASEAGPISVPKMQHGLTETELSGFEDEDHALRHPRRWPDRDEKYYYGNQH
jgi:hypothetical protein